MVIRGFDDHHIVEAMFKSLGLCFRDSLRIRGRAQHEGCPRSRGEGVQAKKIIPCLDVKNGKVVKGVRFKGLMTWATSRYGGGLRAQGADEVTFLDIAASLETRQTILDLVSETAEKLFVPLTVGGAYAPQTT